MKLSIVIVNYKVPHFLEQCLRSVEAAITDLQAEVFVVDNHSQDGSDVLVREKFPWVQYIGNSENLGFSKANNKAIRIASGEFVLLLNPDTVLGEDSLLRSIRFMESRSDSGALGIKMLDGQGRFLPESKRALPTPLVAFYKMTGLSNLFPKSKRFARYHLGHLSPNQNHPVEILAGAFMLMRREALEKAGLLDEDFFMYGEDIDLSYRIELAGYKNYYFSETPIIHYKGESTKKGSLNYVYVFYQAMAIFAQKHFSKGYARSFKFFIQLAIALRAGLSLLKRAIKFLSMPVLDAALLFGGLWWIMRYWEQNHRFVQGGEYPPELVYLAFPAYILFWLLSLAVAGVYSRPSSIAKLLKALGLGTLLILVVYALLDEAYRFSRAIIVLGAIWAMLALPSLRFLLQKGLGLQLLNLRGEHKRLGIVGGKSEFERVDRIIRSNLHSEVFTGRIGLREDTDSEQTIGNLEQLKSTVVTFELEEVIFCGADLSNAQIIACLEAQQSLKVEFKIAPKGSYFVIGSNSIHRQGSWYGQSNYDLNQAGERQLKRLFDLLSAVLLLLSFPLLWPLSHFRKGYFSDAIQVLFGLKSWVGYDQNIERTGLPKLRPSIFYPSQLWTKEDDHQRGVQSLNELYARDYRWTSDLKILWQQYFTKWRKPKGQSSVKRK